MSGHLPCTAMLSMPRPTHFNVKLLLIGGHLQRTDTFAWSRGCPFMTGTTVDPRLADCPVRLSHTPLSSPSSYSHFYVGSMYNDIRFHVARSYTSSAYSPFSLMSSFTLSNHLLLGLPLSLLPCTVITIALVPT